MQDARNRREPASYVQTILRYARGAEITQVGQQLIWAY